MEFKKRAASLKKLFNNMTVSRGSIDGAGGEHEISGELLLRHRSRGERGRVNSGRTRYYNLADMPSIEDFVENEGEAEEEEEEEKDFDSDEDDDVRQSPSMRNHRRLESEHDEEESVDDEGLTTQNEASSVQGSP